MHKSKKPKPKGEFKKQPCGKSPEPNKFQLQRALLNRILDHLSVLERVLPKVEKSVRRFRRRFPSHKIEIVTGNGSFENRFTMLNLSCSIPLSRKGEGREIDERDLTGREIVRFNKFGESLSKLTGIPLYEPRFLASPTHDVTFNVGAMIKE